MRVIITSGHTAQKTFGDQTAGNNDRWPYNPFGTVVLKVIWVRIQAKLNAIHRYLLADIPRNNTRVIAIFFQVVIFGFGGPISQVKRLGDIIMNNLLIRVQGEKEVMEHLNVIPGFNGNIILSFGGESLNGFAVSQQVNTLLIAGNHLITFVNDIPTGRKTCYDDNNSQQFYVLKGLIYIF